MGWVDALHMAETLEENVDNMSILEIKLLQGIGTNKNFGMLPGTSGVTEMEHYITHQQKSLILAYCWFKQG